MISDVQNIPNIMHHADYMCFLADLFTHGTH